MYSGIRTCSRWAWELSVSSGMLNFHPEEGTAGESPEMHVADNDTANSSARDQLTQQPVAVKKIMKPFSTPVLSKRTYRELKLLKHLRHENVSRAISAQTVACH